MIKENLPMTIGTQSLVGVHRPTDVKDYPIEVGNYFSVFDPEWLTKYEKKEASRIDVYKNTISVLNMCAENYEALVRFFHFQSCEAYVYSESYSKNHIVKWALISDLSIPSSKWLNEISFGSSFRPNAEIRNQMEEDYQHILESLNSRC